jgi:hypothetical protein
MQELDKLEPTPGGVWGNLFNSNYVFKVGTSTIFLNMGAISTLILLGIFVILFFFTPLGLVIFRGGLHNGLGAMASLFGAKTLGKHLTMLPAYLNRYKSSVKAFGMYMHNEFIPQYKNNITAIAFMGTAFLILNIGLRGVKLMVAHEPTLIILAIIVEMIVLLLLGLTTWYEKSLDGKKEEETGLKLDKEELLNDLSAMSKKVANS